MRRDRTKDEQFAALRAAGVKIPPCPQVVTDLQQVLQESDSGNQAVARLIGRDIKLASVVFKTANSAAYAAGGKKFVSLDQAVTMLGRRTIANIVRMAALQLTLSGPDPRFMRFWEHSMDIAMLCSIVAENAPNSGELSGDQAFTAGLFHDCGVAVMMQHFDDYCRAFSDPQMPPPDILEQDGTVGMSHVLVGRMVAREWSLPEFVCETIGSHHAPLAEVPKAGATATAALLMGMHIANLRSKVDDSAWDAQRAAVVAHLGLAEGNLGEFEDEVWRSFQVFH